MILMKNQRVQNLWRERMGKKYFVYTPDIPENPIVMDGPDSGAVAEAA